MTRIQIFYLQPVLLPALYPMLLLVNKGTAKFGDKVAELCLLKTGFIPPCEYGNMWKEKASISTFLFSVLRSFPASQSSCVSVPRHIVPSFSGHLKYHSISIFMELFSFYF